MKKNLLWLILLGTNIAIAQSLFPGLEEFGGREEKVNPPVVAAEAVSQEESMPQIVADSTGDVAQGTEDEVVEDVTVEVPQTEPDLFKKKEEQPVVKAAPEVAQVEEDVTEDDEQSIVIYMEAARAVIPPGMNNSYCFGRIKFSNGFRKPVQELSVVVTYGAYSTPYNVRNLLPEVEQTGVLGLVGEACQSIMEMPDLEIKRCVIEGVPEDKCKSKVSFLPLSEP